MQYHDDIYLNLVEDVLSTGIYKGDRTGTGTISTFAREMRFNLSDGTIPLLTTKKMHTRSVIHELLWYLQGNTNIKYLNDNGVTIWDEWADENGELGPVYGKQWRRWDSFDAAHIDWAPDKPICEVKFKEIDQIADVIDKLRNNPNDRRMIVNAWNVGELDEMALPPCHYSFQFWVDPSTSRLSCLLNQRSCDVGLGVPFNIVQYSILVHMIAKVSGYVPGEFIWRGGDVHIYTNHIDQLKEQITRVPYPSPKLILDNSIKEIDDFRFEHFQIDGYVSHPTIKMEVSV